MQRSSFSHQPGRLAAVVVILLIVFASTRAGRAAQVDVAMQPDAEASIRLTSINANWDGLGWQPVVVRVENHAERARMWELRFNVGAAYNRGASVTTPVVIQVPARSTRETMVFVPGPGRLIAGYSHMTARWNVDVSGPDVAVDQVSGSVPRDLNFAQIATSPGMEEAVRRMIPAVPAGTYTPAPHEVEPIDPLRWPADWRVWSSFANIVISREEYDMLDGARRNALREWVAQGGVLWLIPTGGREKGEAAEQALGLGRIHSRLETLLSRAQADQSLRVTPWQRVFELITDQDRDDWALDRPVVALIIFLVIFGIVVGPVNAFVFAPASRRYRLFFTVPAFSVGASLLLCVVIVVKDGFGGAGVRRSLVVLLPGENKAVVFQQQVARTGVLLRSEFALPADTSISVGKGSSGAVNATREMERENNRAAGAWFTSRALQEHDLRRITPTRARVELVDGGAGGRAPVVQSSVTTVLRDFRYVDPEGKRWTADELPPGQRVTLSSATTVDAGDAPGFFRAFGGATDLAPLPTHASIAWNEETIIYTGRVEAARQP